ncbi:HAAS domain-containing protein [Chitinibacter sp. ZOR0017]|uniref:HAAS signaling domain-containing protein n=1 Tax=Chitinibacter sp. ZOR0017 TaxID=1339254 RepID=UPI000689D41C|nr:DUF1700 domain-containing protein [Chitinibacter sp. ZOR0017]
MNQQEFIAQLERALRQLPAAEVRDIVTEYQGYFAEAIASGRSEAEFSAALGYPEQLAQEILARSNVPAWQKTKSYVFQTNENSGWAWVRHAWHIFKQAPVMFTTLGVLFVAVEMSLPDSFLKELEAFALAFLTSLFISVVVALAWQVEEGEKLLPHLKYHQQRKQVLWRIFFGAVIWAVIWSVQECLGDLIAGRELGISIAAEKTGLEELFFWSTMVLGLLFLFTNALVVIERVSIWSAFKLSLKAGFKCWRPLLASVAMVYALAMIGAVGVIAFFVNAEYVTGIDVPLSAIFDHAYFYAPIFGWVAALLSLLSYSCWAAVFRDGPMRMQVHRS